MSAPVFWTQKGLSVDGSAIPLGPGGNYPTYLDGPSRTNNAPFASGSINDSTAGSLQALWTFSDPNEIASQPIVANGIVYFGSWDGYEYALYATNSTLVWKTFLGLATGDTRCGNNSLGITSTATYTGANVIVNGGTPALVVLNSSTGKIAWNLSLGGPTSKGFYLWSSPLVYQGEIYDGIASLCDKPLVPAGLAEVSVRTHRMVNYFNSSVPETSGSSIWASPSMSVSSNTVFVTTGNAQGNTTSSYDDSIVALNATTLAVKASWQVPAAQQVTDGDFGSTPVAFTSPGGAPMVVAVDKNGYVYDWNQSNLGLNWEDQISNKTTIPTVSYGGNRLYALSPRTTIGGVTYNASVRAINPRTGAYIWQDGLANVVTGYGSPVYFPGVLVVPDGKTAYVIDAVNGKILTTLAPGGNILSPPSYSRSELFIPSADGLTAYAVKLTVSASDELQSSTTYGFNASVSGGLPAYTYNWSFGDGTYASTATPVHAYSTAGTYNVTVIVSDLAGHSAVSNLTLAVSDGLRVRPEQANSPGRKSRS